MWAGYNRDGCGGTEPSAHSGVARDAEEARFIHKNSQKTIVSFISFLRDGSFRRLWTGTIGVPS